MRLPALIAGLILTAVSALPSLAAGFDSPKALLTALYAPYLKDDGDTSDVTPFLSGSLASLYAKDAANTPDGEVGVLDFDPVIAGQDYAITKLQIDDPTITGDKATATVHFENFDEKQELDYVLVKENGGWKVDDIESKRGEYPWDLRQIFVEGESN